MNFAKTTLDIVKKVGPQALAMAAVGGGFALADRALDEIQEGIKTLRYNNTLEKKLDQLVALQPVLGSVDREFLKLYYDQLRHFAPVIAENDLAAASYIRHAIQFHDQGMPIATYETLAKTQKELVEGKGKRSTGIFGRALMSGAGSTFGSPERVIDLNQGSKLDNAIPPVYDFKPLFYDK